MSHPGDEEQGELFNYSLMSLFIFGIFDRSLDDKKLKDFARTEPDGQKSRWSVCLCVITHLDRLIGTTSGHDLNILFNNCLGKKKITLSLA